MTTEELDDEEPIREPPLPPDVEDPGGDWEAGLFTNTWAAR